MATSIARQAIDLAECPACKKPIRGDLTVELGPIELGAEEARVKTLRVTGFQVSHDCRPKATRGVG